MTYFKKAKQSLHKASLETTRLMGAQLRAETRASGWPEHIVRGMHVKYDDGQFVVHSHPEHKDDVLNLEYGTPDSQPTAAIRRYANRTSEAEKFLLGRTSVHLGAY